MKSSRTALTLRCSWQDASTLRAEALSEHRSISGCVLNILERQLSMQEQFVRGLSESFIQAKAREFRLLHREGNRTRMLLRCSEEEAERIRAMARRREMSISEFIVFCLRRHWEARGEARKAQRTLPWKSGQGC